MNNKKENIFNTNKIYYKTKQRSLIIEYLKKHTKSHITASCIIEYFYKNNISVSKATVYRNLDFLVKDGIISKYVTDDNVSCYSYISPNCKNTNHYHLKCENCNKIFHIDNEDFLKISKQIKNNFDFDIDISKSVFYGKCKNCKKLNTTK